MKYHVRYIHKIHPSQKDVGPDIELNPKDFLDRKALGNALKCFARFSS